MSLPDFCRTQLNDRGNDFAFFNEATASLDCNVATTSQCVQLVTGAKLDSETVREIGEADPDKGTSTLLTQKVFIDQGMEKGIDFVRFTHVDVQRVRDLLAGGWFVVGFVNYGVLVDNGAPVGSTTYRDAHAIGLSGWGRYLGKRVTWDFDPLFDGRSRWINGRKHTYPMGRQRVKFGLIREAMTAFTGEINLVSGYAVKPR